LHPQPCKATLKIWLSLTPTRWFRPAKKSKWTRNRHGHRTWHSCRRRRPGCSQRRSSRAHPGMDFQVLYTEPELADLEEVMRWPWENHPGTSERFANALLNHVDLLKDLPYLGAPVRRYHGVRRLQHSPLLVYYRGVLESRRVEILHLWHSSRRDPLL